MDFLPCPFCGAEARAEEHYSHYWAVVADHAEGCPIAALDFERLCCESEEELAEAWNSRPVPVHEFACEPARKMVFSPAC